MCFFFASIFEFSWGKERDSRCIPSKEREVGLVRYLGVVRNTLSYKKKLHNVNHVCGNLIYVGKTVNISILLRGYTI